MSPKKKKEFEFLNVLPLIVIDKPNRIIHIEEKKIKKAVYCTWQHTMAEVYLHLLLPGQKKRRKPNSWLSTRFAFCGL